MSKHKGYRNWYEDLNDEIINKELENKYGNIFDDDKPTAVTDEINEGTGTRSATLDDEDYTGGWGGGYHHHTGYKSYFYSRTFDFSVSLETRVKQLIKTISGKDLKLVQATGWGCDDDHFYYNPSDLTDATDDEVLGLIFHQLARELNYPKVAVKSKQELEPDYRHLVEKLEDLRADKLMRTQYQGVEYYQTNLWESIQKEHNKPTYGYGAIPALFFLYNLSCLANNDKEYLESESPKDTLEKFIQVIPDIEAYLNAPTYEQAQAHYQVIKANYPKPTHAQQESMDAKLNGASLSMQAMKLAQEAEQELAKKWDKEANTGSLAGKSEKQKLRNKDYLAYQNEVLAQSSIINALHRQLASVLKDNEAKRYLGRQKRGKIDTKALHKLAVLGSNRVFKKERAINKKRYAFSLLVDQSGSMNSGGKIQSAFSGLVVLAEVFNRLGVAFSVSGFDDYTTKYKSFFAQPRKEVLGGIRQAVGGGTNDLQAIENVKNQMDKELDNSYQRAMFVLSDGDGLYGETKGYVQELAMKDNIKVFGIGLGLYVDEQSLQKTFDRYAHIPQVADLPKTLVSLVREQFIRQ